MTTPLEVFIRVFQCNSGSDIAIVLDGDDAVMTLCIHTLCSTLMPDHGWVDVMSRDGSLWREFQRLVRLSLEDVTNTTSDPIRWYNENITHHKHQVLLMKCLEVLGSTIELFYGTSYNNQCGSSFTKNKQNITFSDSKNEGAEGESRTIISSIATSDETRNLSPRHLFVDDLSLGTDRHKKISRQQQRSRIGFMFLVTGFIVLFAVFFLRYYIRPNEDMLTIRRNRNFGSGFVGLDVVGTGLSSDIVDSDLIDGVEEFKHMYSTILKFRYT